MMGYHGAWDSGWGMGHAVLGGTMMLLFWAAVIAAIVLAVRWLAPKAGSGATGRTPLTILQERFAKGEIDAPEYEARKKLLSE